MLVPEAPTKYAPIEFTPLYTGIPPVVKGTSPLVGGGYVEPLLLNTLPPGPPAPSAARGPGGAVNVSAESNFVVPLVTMVGISSSFASQGLRPVSETAAELTGTEQLYYWNLVGPGGLGDGSEQERWGGGNREQKGGRGGKGRGRAPRGPWPADARLAAFDEPTPRCHPSAPPCRRSTSMAAGATSPTAAALCAADAGGGPRGFALGHGPGGPQGVGGRQGAAPFPNTIALCCMLPSLDAPPFMSPHLPTPPPSHQDNLAITPLIRRRVGRIISCVATSTPVDTNATHWAGLQWDVAGLFGAVRRGAAGGGRGIPPERTGVRCSAAVASRLLPADPDPSPTPPTRACRCLTPPTSGA
jgi:hypothetical protein